MRTTTDDEPMITSINVTPLVDIVLVLLIVLMVAAVYVSAKSIPVDASSSTVGDGSPLVVSIDARGALYLDAEPLDARELAIRARAHARRDPHVAAIVTADPAASHGAFVRAIDVLRGAGVTRYTVAVLAEP